MVIMSLDKVNSKTAEQTLKKKTRLGEAEGRNRVLQETHY